MTKFAGGHFSDNIFILQSVVPGLKQFGCVIGNMSTAQIGVW